VPPLCFFFFFKLQYDRTALIYASRYGHTAVVKLLLEADAEKDASDKVNGRRADTVIISYLLSCYINAVVQHSKFIGVSKFLLRALLLYFSSAFPFVLFLYSRRFLCM